MNVTILSRKFIKPSTPTPHDLRNFRISFNDEMAPTMNGPIIIYYSCNDSNGRNSNTSTMFKQSLLHSLPKVLQQFYPFAGRYIKESRTIDCNDEGAEYLEAQVDAKLNDLLLSPEMKPEHLNCLLPCEFGAADEVSDPILSIQVNTFECGGLAIGFSISHRISDVSTAATFFLSWANASFGKGRENDIVPSFNSPIYFPGRNIPKFELGIPRTTKGIINTGPKVVTRRFVFESKAVLDIRSKMMDCMNNGTMKAQPSRVHLVSGLILRAVLDMDRKKHGRPRSSLILQPVNFRDKTIPTFPNHSCGNICTFAIAQCTAEEIGGLDTLEGCVNLLNTSVKETVADCKKILNSGEEGNLILINSFKRATELLYQSTDLNAITLNSWCRMPFYEADFGWGKPTWLSLASLPARNFAVLVDTKEGDGIEAWITLEENDMFMFQQVIDQEVKSFTT